MTAQRLYELLKFLDALDQRLGLQPSLEAVTTSLSNIVSSPAAPQYQSQLAETLKAFEAAAAKLAGSITPSQYGAITAMGGERFFDPSIAQKVKASVQTNAMTPSVARDFAQELATERSGFLTTVRTARQNLERLGIRASTLEPGSADLAFLIPRDMFDNKLSEFAKELNFISRLLQDFSEALTGKAEHVELEQLSSSIPTVALLASVPVIGAVLVVVNKFLDAWLKVEKIRKIRADLAEIGMEGGHSSDELTARIETTVEEVVEESTKFVLSKYEGPDTRKNELANALRQDTRRLFGQIERGLTVESRTEPKKGADAEEEKALTDISVLASGLQFPQIANHPMLLESGEVLEGELQKKRSKKTMTIRTTNVSKKGAPRDGGNAAPKE